MFSNLIVAYLFLGGTGAGCCFVASLLAVFADPDELDAVLRCRMRSAQAQIWKRFFLALYIAALIVLLLGVICLMADLGRPDRLLSLLFQPAPTFIAFGAWSIIASGVLTTLNLLLWAGAIPGNRRLVLVSSILEAIAALAVFIYTGLLLSTVQAVPLWNTPWLVALFSLSALSCGIALSLLAAFFSRSMAAFTSVLLRLVKADAVIIALEAVIAAFCLASVWSAAGGITGPTDDTARAAFASLESLVLGPWAVLFWAGFAFVGLAVPFIQDMLVARSSRSFRGARSIHNSSAITGTNARTLIMLGTAACVLAGGFILRLLVVQAALHPTMAFLS